MTTVSVPQNSSNATQPGKRVLAIAGSLRTGSWNLRLLEAAVELAPAGMTISVHHNLASIPLFDEDLEHATDGGPDPVRRLRHAVASADGLLIATPEYNQSIPGVLKNTIDWLSRATPDEVLAGKPIAIIGATMGRWGTRLAQHALRQTLCATESLVMPAPALFIMDAAKLFDDAGRLSDIPTLKSLQAVLDSFANWIDLVAPQASTSPASNHAVV
ncbi:MAG TPA: NADPH-dependent FMN reductase [Luteimonas sp.]|nr:NADPH-dependent FMN reductase [Luteimonas sp.]